MVLSQNQWSQLMPDNALPVRTSCPPQKLPPADRDLTISFPPRRAVNSQKKIF
jgi:hypothetical protein